MADEKISDLPLLASPSPSDEVEILSGGVNKRAAVGTLPTTGTSVVVQVVNTQTGAAANGTGTIPFDNTIPQNTEGDEYMTLAITPTNAANKLKVEVVFVFTNSAVVFEIIALFKDSVANALAAATGYTSASTAGMTITFTHYMTAGTTSPITFKVRAGGHVPGTTYFNSHSGFVGGLFGDVLASSITITEIIP